VRSFVDFHVDVACNTNAFCEIKITYLLTYLLTTCRQREMTALNEVEKASGLTVLTELSREAIATDTAAD